MDLQRITRYAVTLELDPHECHILARALRALIENEAETFADTAPGYTAITAMQCALEAAGVAIHAFDVITTSNQSALTLDKFRRGAAGKSDNHEAMDEATAATARALWGLEPETRTALLAQLEETAVQQRAARERKAEQTHARDKEIAAALQLHGVSRMEATHLLTHLQDLRDEAEQRTSAAS